MTPQSRRSGEQDRCEELDRLLTLRGTSRVEENKVKVVTSGGRRYMLLGCHDIMVNGHKDEAVALDFGVLSNGNPVALLFAESALRANPELRKAGAFTRSLGSMGAQGGIRYVLLDGKIPPNYEPAEQASPLPGTKMVVFAKTITAA